ncbi:TFIID-18kDa-domain-containing protein [Rostrohypoxylon terebratum]|nr:TFIID-18kDa-domain-containing protein [Rostrohypoxylon terebratum]
MEPRARAGKNVGKETFNPRDISQLLYAYGDVPEPLQETVRVLDEIVTEFLEGVCFEASRHAQVAGRQKLKFDDFEFALRHSPQYLGRVRTMVEKRQNIKEARRLFDKDNETISKEHGALEAIAGAPSMAGRKGRGGGADNVDEDDELLGLDEDEDLQVMNRDTSSKGTGGRKRKRPAK